METLIIGKPAMNIYLPLQEFPQEGDIFTIKAKNDSLGNVAATSACLLGKWNIPVHFTGVMGNDAYAEKIRDTFKEYKVETKYLETDFVKGTSLNYYILNAKTGIVTKILYNDPESQLQKFKYDFTPEFAILDGTDFAGAYALLNNNANCKTVFYARTGNKDTIALSKRCTWVVCTQTFAEMMAKMESDGSAASYVDLYQKIVDSAGNSNYIVILNNHKILYSVEGKVKMLPEMKINIADYSSFDSIFVGALSFALINNVALDDAIKLANTAAAISISRIGEVPAIPELDEVLDNSGLREKLGMANNTATTVAQAQEVEPLNPNYYTETTEAEPMITAQTSQEETMTQAFGGTNLENAPAETGIVQEIPQEPVQNALEQGESGLINEQNATASSIAESPEVSSQYSEESPMNTTILQEPVQNALEQGESGLINEQNATISSIAESPEVSLQYSEEPVVENMQEQIVEQEAVIPTNEELLEEQTNQTEMTEERINQAFNAMPAEGIEGTTTEAATNNETIL